MLREGLALPAVLATNFPRGGLAWVVATAFPRGGRAWAGHMQRRLMATTIAEELSAGHHVLAPEALPIAFARASAGLALESCSCCASSIFPHEGSITSGAAVVSFKPANG